MSLSGYGLFTNRSTFKDDDGEGRFVFNSSIGLLESGTIGAAAIVKAQLGLLETTAAFRTTLRPANTISAVVVDSDIYRDSRVIRVVLSCRDVGFNTKVATNTRLYAKATIGTSATDAANCQPHATTGTCVVTLTAPATWINGNTITLSHGLTSSGPWVTASTTVTPHGYTPLNFTDNFLLTIPAAPVLPGATFSISVIARAAQDLESGKFIIVFAGVDSLQVVVSLAAGISMSHSEVWRYQTTAEGNVLTVVINRKPDANSLTNDAQEEQEIMTANVVLQSSLQSDAISVQLQVLELNAPNPVNPGGGPPIPEDGFVLGHVQGLLNHVASVGNITVASDVAVGLVASVAGGRGTFVNMAPLTGEVASAPLVMSVIHRYGAVLRAHTSATCSLADERNLGVNVTTGACRLTFHPTAFEATDEATIHIATGALRARLPVKVWAPALPLTLRLERSISRPIRMGRLGAHLVDPANLCRRQFSASKLQVRASFTANGTAAFQVDVTDVVRSRLEVSNSAVAELGTAANHTVVVGVGNGVTSIGFDVAALGSTDFEVDADSFVFIDDFAVDIFSGVALELDAPNLAISATQGARGVLLPQNMIQPGFAGRHYLGATLLMMDPNDGYGWRSDVTLFSQVSYNSSVSSVAGITAGATITPAMAGTTWVTAIWNTSICGNNGSTSVSTPTPAVVTLPAASGTHITNAAGSTITSVLIANANDPAHSSQSAVAEHRIRVKIVYGNSYTRDLTTDGRTTFGFADETSESLVGIAVCEGSSGNMCLTANAGVNGTARLLVTFAHETVTATLTVNVVRAVGLSLVAHPFPAWPQSSSIVVSTLRLIDVTQTYQQAQLLPSMLRSDGQAFHVTASTGLSCILLTANGAVIINGRHATDFVVQPTRVGQFTFRCHMGLLLGDNITIAAASTPGNIASFFDVSVHGAVGNTVHGVRGTLGRHQVRFGARFDDGWVITKTNMFSALFPSTFRPRLASFSSGNVGVLLCNSVNGSLTPMANSPETIALTVSSLNGNIATVTGSFATYVNLKAGQLDVDFAATQARISQGTPFTTIAEGGSLSLKVYVTTGSVHIGALTLGIRFDPRAFSYTSTATGADDNVWQDTVLGEVSSTDPSLLRIGGVTTSYAHGTNWHFATVTFQSTTPSSGPGSSEPPAGMILSGSIIEMVNADAVVVVDSGTSIIAGNQTTVVINRGGRRDRRQLDDVATTVAATTAADNAVSTTPAAQACAVGRGPYPLGDVNQDCGFTGLDVLLAAQYTVISHDRQAVVSFLNRDDDISVDAMDADVNGRVDPVDTSLLLYVLFGAARFIQRPVLETAMPDVTDAEAQCQFSLSIDVEQSSADDLFFTDPSRSAATAVLAIFTGGASNLSALQNVSWGTRSDTGGLTSLDDYASDGRFLAYRQAINQVGRNRYTVSAGILLGSADVIGVSFGVSVVQVVYADDAWRVPFDGQYMSVGSRYPSDNQTENRQSDMAGIEFDISQSAAPISFTYRGAFAPMQIVTIAQGESNCIVSTTTTTSSSTSSTSTSSTTSSSSTSVTSTTSTFSTVTNTSTSTTISSTTTSTTSTATATAAATTTSLQILQQLAVQAEEPDWWKQFWWILLIIGIVVLCCCCVVCAKHRRRNDKQVQATAPVAIVSEQILESMMVADHGADLGGWRQSEDAQLWGQDNTSPLSPEGYLEVDGRGAAPFSGVKQILERINQLDNRYQPAAPRSHVKAPPKRLLFDLDSPGGATPEKPWEDIYPTQSPADPAELPADIEEHYRGLALDGKDHKKTMRRRMSFFNKGGKSRAKLTKEQLKWADALRQSEEAAVRPVGSMPRTMARPAVIDDGAAMMRAASKPASSPGGIGQALRKTGAPFLEHTRLEDAQRKQQWFERFNNNTVWDPSEEKWIYQKLDAWMSWGLAPREFEEPIYEHLHGSETDTNHNAAAGDQLGDLTGGGGPPAAPPPPVPSTLTRAPISTLNRRPLKPPTVTVVNGGGGGYASNRNVRQGDVRPDSPGEADTVGLFFKAFAELNTWGGNTELTEDELNTQLTQDLLARYLPTAVVQQLDADGDGQVTAAEIMAALDLDHSGGISVTEFIRGVKKLTAGATITLEDLIYEDRPLGAVGTGAKSISDHFDPTGHSGYLSMRPDFQLPDEVPRLPAPAFGQGPVHFHPT